MTFTYFIVHLLSLAVKIHATEQGAPHHQTVKCDVPNASFRRNQDQYLWADKISSYMAADNLECTFLCSNEPKCFSFNMAAHSDSEGRYLCELLPTDKYRANDKFNANDSFHHYSRRSSCESSPCKNGGDCVPDYEWNSYDCDCKGGFFGKNCDCKDVMENRTCSHIKYCYPAARSGFFLIDPDGEGDLAPFEVNCNMTAKNGVGVTLVSHDSEDRTLVDGYSERGSYSRSISYHGIGVAQLASLTNQSAHCEQFIQYECYDSRLFRNGNQYGWWVSRQGLKMTYWGGVQSGDYKCACAATNTCANPSYGCNCDKNDYEWREDSGFLSDKSHLPVIQLRFGDTGYSSEDQGYHTLGKLKCYGRADI